jgi:hypothetical protein
MEPTMTDDQQAAPESLLPYDEWTETALRQVVAKAVAHVAVHGLPGQHHFYISFRTDHPGVVIPPRLRAQYPQEMTIVLQHQFWDLKMDDEAGLISVGLSFGGVGSILVIPLEAVTGFADPQIGLQMRFRANEPAEAEPEPEPTAEEPAPAALQPPSETPQVVSLDAFRRRTPPKD